MKNLFIFISCAISFIAFPQDSLRRVPKTKFFSISPMSKNTENVNGIVFGAGHIDNKRVKNQSINGLNIEVNPAPIVGGLGIFMAIMYLPEIIDKKKTNSYKDTIPLSKLVIQNFNYTPNLKINGLNLSTGCFFVRTEMNGLNISLGNKFKKLNGISIAPLGNLTDTQNGISFGLINFTNKLSGLNVGVLNQSQLIKGSQLGVYNLVKENKGLQIGLINKSYSKGFQVGLWNKNSSRSLPFVNW